MFRDIRKRSKLSLFARYSRFKGNNLQIRYSLDQIEFACTGMRITDRSRDIAIRYFCHGVRKVDLSKEYKVSTAYISKLINNIESNFQKRLDLHGLEIVVVMRPKSS